MYKHIIDRSNLDEVVALVPKGHPDNPDGLSPKRTRREELERYPTRYFRSDIVLLNCTRSGQEYCLYAAGEGFKGDLWILDILTDDEFAQVTGIAERMRQNAKDFAPAWKLL